MFKKTVKVFMVIMALLGFSAVSQAADATVDSTVILQTPISTVEVNGWSMALNRKAGYTFPPTAQYAQGGTWTTYYDKDPYTAQVAGCFRVPGEQSYPFSLNVIPATVVDCGGPVINMTTPGPSDKWVGSIDDISCEGALAGTYTIININGSTTHTIPASGTKFVSWKMGPQVTVKINSATQQHCVANGIARALYM